MGRVRFRRGRKDSSSKRKREEFDDKHGQKDRFDNLKSKAGFHEDDEDDENDVGSGSEKDEDDNTSGGDAGQPDEAGGSQSDVSEDLEEPGLGNIKWSSTAAHNWYF